MRRTLGERFWAKVDRSAGPDGCWPWLGAHGRSGAGLISVANRHRQATHIALELAGRPLATGMQACHRCDNPPCCNPTHLFAGSQSDNIADAVAKGRALVGRLNTNAIDHELVPQIAAASGSTYAVARRFGVSQNTVVVIRHGRHWAQRGAA